MFGNEDDLSDDDSFFDRTGAVEKRSDRAGKRVKREDKEGIVVENESGLREKMRVGYEKKMELLKKSVQLGAIKGKMIKYMGMILEYIGIMVVFLLLFCYCFVTVLLLF